MISQHKNRVQAIKNKFENLNTDSVPLIVNKKTKPQLNKHFNSTTSNLLCENASLSSGIHNKENKNITNDQSDTQNISFITESESSSEDIPKPNSSYLYNKSDVNRSVSNCKKSLTRQISDPGKKLHRSHAFRCDRSQKINDSPKRHGSCHGRSESSNFVLKSPEKRLSKERLKKLGNVLEDHMKRENFVLSVKSNNSEEMNPGDSIPDSDVPKHILDQYAKVDKTKKKEFENKQDGMTDSGVSSETEIAEDEKTNKVKQLLNHFEKPEEKLQSKPNLEFMNSLCASTETMRIERKNPHLQLTDTLKKALKQPLPMGPPPKKPPRVFAIQPITEQSEKPKKDTKKMLEKLEQVLQQREAQNQSKNIYDVAETNLTLEKPKEIHYLCTEILDITHKTLLPNHNLADSVTKCLTSLNCAIPSQSMSSLPYTRMSIHSDSNRNSMKMCCSCSTDSLDHNTRRLSTFLGSQPCVKCQSNEVKDTNFKCHLNCNCKDGNSKFFVEKEKEHIYDVPFVKKCDSVVVRSFRNKNRYGTLNSCKNHSKSMEDLRTDRDDDQKIYDIPCEESRPATPEPEFVTSSPKMEFQKLRSNFENGCVPDMPTPATPKPILINRSQVSKSSENLEEKKPVQAHFRKFNTERKGRDRGGRISIPKRNHQLDVDKENLNRLMSEIYEAVTACNMEENKPVSFPTDNSSSSEESIKLTRSLTEKRKNYLRRVSSKVANLENRSARFRHQTSICSYNSEVIDNPYSTFRSWKSFRTSQQALNQSTKMASLNHSTDNHQSTDSKFNLTDSSGNVLSMRDELDASSEIIDNLSVDEKADCIDIELPFEPRERGLFNVCLLVGLNYMSGEAYVKSVFPSQVQVPPHIENLIFPETLSGRGDSVEANSTQCYSIVLTNERGDRCYGYCRRVLPEGASTCLPLCYCLIGKYRAPGFYYKVLEEIESHHGSSDEEISNILQQLFETDLPDPGQSIQITTPNTQTNILRTSDTSVTSDSEKCKTLPVREKVNEVNGLCRSESEGNRLELYDLQNNNAMVNVLVDVAPRIRTIKMPIEPRTIEDSFSILLDTLGAGLVIKVFASMLLERKVILFSDSLSLASSCLAGLQQILYPLVWQQPLISLAGSSLRSAALDAPLPILCAAIRPSMPPIEMPEGMLLDLTLSNKVLIYQGDESTILPAASYKTLKTALQMETGKHKDGQTDTKTRNVMISEAFLRFFVDIFGDFWRFFSFGELKDDGLGKEDVVFDKEAFIKNAATKQNQYFLEWFIESSMFIHFIQNMAMIYKSRQSQGPSAGYEAKLVDTPLPNFYEIFEERTKVRIKSKSVDKGNYKNAMNKRMRLLKNKLRDLIA